MIDLEAICTGLNRGDSSSNRIPTIDLESGGRNPFEAADLTQDIPLYGRITYWVIETIR
jgi:hypothetical protein